MNLLVRPMVGVSPKAGCSIRYSTKATNANSLIIGDLKIDLNFASEVHVGVRSNTVAVKGAVISLQSGGQSV